MLTLEENARGHSDIGERISNVAGKKGGDGHCQVGSHCVDGF